MYLMLLFIGALGFVSMTVLGFLHGGGGSHAGNHPLSGHSHALGGHSHGSLIRGGHHATGHVGHGLHSDHDAHTDLSSNHGNQTARDSRLGSSIWLMPLSLIAPLDIFSMCLGAGAAGIAFKRVMSPDLLIWGALVGALVFNFAIIKPIMANLLRFSSRPSDGLEGMVSQVGTAATNFDSAGKGLVQISMDGQITQLLATMEADEVKHGTQVKKGDTVLIVEVDAVKNTCRVTRELAV